MVTDCSTTSRSKVKPGWSYPQSGGRSRNPTEIAQLCQFLNRLQYWINGDLVFFFFFNCAAAIGLYESGLQEVLWVHTHQFNFLKVLQELLSYS